MDSEPLISREVPLPSGSGYFRVVLRKSSRLGYYSPRHPLEPVQQLEVDIHQGMTTTSLGALVSNPDKLSCSGEALHAELVSYFEALVKAPKLEENLLRLRGSYLFQKVYFNHLLLGEEGNLKITSPRELVSLFLTMTSSRSLSRSRRDYLETFDPMEVTSADLLLAALKPSYLSLGKENLLLGFLSSDLGLPQRFLAPGHLSFYNALAEMELANKMGALEGVENLKVKDWTSACLPEGYLIKAKERAFSPAFVELPLGTKKMKSFVKELTVKEYLSLKGKLPKTLDASSAIAAAKSALKPPTSQDLTHPEVAALHTSFLTLLEERGALIPQGCYGARSLTYEISQNYATLLTAMGKAPGTLQALKTFLEAAKEDPSLTYPLNAPCILMGDLVKTWVASPSSSPELVKQLVEALGAPAAIKTILLVSAHEESLTPKRWNTFISKAEDLGSMPPSWWVPMVK